MRALHTALVGAFLTLLLCFPSPGHGGKTTTNNLCCAAPLSLLLTSIIDAW